MWEAIERLQQGKSLNIQDVKTNLFWEFRKFTSHDGETMESYYTRFYKLMNEMIRNNLTVTTMQVNVQFLQQLQPEWSRKPKRIKDFAYHKEKMLLCKQAEQGVPLQAEQFDWLADTDEEVDEQELEALEQVQNDVGYNVFANDLQHSEQSESVSNTCLLETDDSNVIPDSPNMCEDDIQNDHNDVKSDDERVALANLKLDVDENKKIQKQLKKANTTLAQELKECKTILAETSKSLGSLLVFGIVAWLHFKPSRLILRSIRHLMSISLTMKNLNAQSEILCLYAFPYDQSTHANRLIPEGEETLALERESQSKLNKDLVRPYDYTTFNSLYEIFKPQPRSMRHSWHTQMTSGKNVAKIFCEI
nr:hypothetical protein [Tanacetum cinerariifolium]